MKRTRGDAKPGHAILIVEQDTPTRELYVRELGRDYRVFACRDEREALRLLGDQQISAIVLEPGSAGGWALLAALKRATDMRAIPVILCSTLDERKLGMELGASAYLVKPVLPVTLLDAVRRCIALRAEI
jgi:DNA-binding response OmpR family regulator